MRAIAIAITIVGLTGCAQPSTCHELCVEWAEDIHAGGFTTRNYGFTVPVDDLCTGAHDERFAGVEPGDCEACEAVLMEVEQMCVRRMCGSEACDRMCAQDTNGGCEP